MTKEKYNVPEIEIVYFNIPLKRLETSCAVMLNFFSNSHCSSPKYEKIELSVILELACVIVFAVPIFQAHKLNISRYSSFSFSLLFQVSILAENIIIDNA